jgi:hypothetical protein
MPASSIACSIARSVLRRRNIADGSDPSNDACRLGLCRHRLGDWIGVG